MGVSTTRRSCCPRSRRTPSCATRWRWISRGFESSTPPATAYSAFTSSTRVSTVRRRPADLCSSALVPRAVTH
eukprot:2416249-Prymnesium_polylepis.1